MNQVPHNTDSELVSLQLQWCARCHALYRVEPSLFRQNAAPQCFFNPKQGNRSTKMQGG